jgi:hypothetical protein
MPHVGGGGDRAQGKRQGWVAWWRCLHPSDDKELPCSTRIPLQKRLFGASADTLDARALKVAQHIARRKHISRNVDQELDQAPPTLGQRAADAVATFGGSWALWRFSAQPW